MATLTINATPRTVTGKKNSALRQTGKVPAVVYGHEVKSQNVEVDEREFRKIFKQAGENTIISLKLADKELPVLIHDVQNHYLKDTPVHVDFYAINMTEKLKADIPLEFVGEAPAVKALSGTLVKNLSEVEVECLPLDLPHSIEVDISSLENFESAIRVSDLKIPDKVELLTNPEETVATVAAPRSEEEMKALDEKPVEADVNTVEGVAKPEAPAEGEAAPAAKEDKE
jgi:large subunit ribosomal protein L25